VYLRISRSLSVKKSRQRHLKIMFLRECKYKGRPQFRVLLLFEFQAQHFE
jgi:hypothetical protein